MTLIAQLARKLGLKKFIDDTFSGKLVNHTEGRAALHIALRNLSEEPILVKGKDVMPNVMSVLIKMMNFAERVRSGEWIGYTGKSITDVVNIGIGGSDLGPKTVTKALQAYSQRNLRVHFVSNVDGTDLAETLLFLDPETTLFNVESKTFTTQETITNANSARNWFLDSGATKEDIAKHFVAVSTNREKVMEFGIDPKNMFEFWDWVGGRYSLWSAIGLPVAISVGQDNFYQLLLGAHEMDLHFREAPFDQNIPVILGMLSFWYSNFLGAQAKAVLPYDQYLALLPAHLQQLYMESLGKLIDRDGKIVTYPTGQIIFGEAGTNGQHSFYQLLHQGGPNRLIPADFLAARTSQNPTGNHHQNLIANLIAQPEALMNGKTAKEVASEFLGDEASPEAIQAIIPYKVFPGNRPTNLISYEMLDPRTLGNLIAMYEHAVLVESVLLNINPFDQMGVELGKMLAKKILPELDEGAEIGEHDASTRALIEYFRNKQMDLIQ